MEKPEPENRCGNGGDKNPADNDRIDEAEKEQQNTPSPEDEVDAFFREIGANLKRKWLHAKLGESVTAAATVLLAIVAISSFWVYYEQMRANQVSANAARSAADTAARQLEIMDRPWVTIDVFIAAPLAYSDKGVQMTFSFVPKNIGHSPAQNVSIQAQLAPVDMLSDIREVQQRMCRTASYDHEGGLAKYALFPAEPYSQNFVLDLPTDSIVGFFGKMPPGVPQPDPIPIAVVGCVDYTYETSPRRHETGFALDVFMKDGRMPLRSHTPIDPASLVLMQHPGGGHFAN